MMRFSLIALALVATSIALPIGVAQSQPAPAPLPAAEEATPEREDEPNPSPAPPSAPAPAPAHAPVAPALVVEAPAPVAEAPAPVAVAPSPVAAAAAPAAETPARIADAPAPIPEAPAPQAAPVAAPSPLPVQQIIQIPIPTTNNDGASSDSWERISRLIPGLPGEGLELRHLLLLLFAFVVFDTAIRRLRNRMPREGVFPLLFAILQILIRVSIFFVVLGLPAVLASPSFAPMIVWVLLAAGAALGWSARDFLPDLLAGLILLFERRIRRGMWISGEGYAGIVIWLGLRSTWLRDSHGHRVGVPNRRLMESPVVADASGDTVQEVALRIDSSRPAHAIRQALRDAVLTSPWIFPDCDPVVLREPTDPDLWRVRARLLESRFATRFEGELLERAEEILEQGDADPVDTPSEPLFDAMLD